MKTNANLQRKFTDLWKVGCCRAPLGVLWYIWLVLSNWETRRHVTEDGNLNRFTICKHLVPAPRSSADGRDIG